MGDFDYVHGFDRKEQDRLLHQADFLEPYVFSGVDLEFRKNLLEIGCGVGAQTMILCRRFPKIKVTSVDLSEKQLALAQKNLKSLVSEGRVRLHRQDAQTLKLKERNFDSAFICWFLEHVPDPLLVLKRAKEHLKKGAKIYVTEVFNQTLFVEPYSQVFLKYWHEFNELQWSLKGHPFVGASLGHLLSEAGYADINVEIRPFHFDSREPEKRAAFTEEFYNIMLSAEKSLLKSGRISPAEFKQMKKEVEIVKKSKDSVFFYCFVHATATVR